MNRREFLQKAGIGGLGLVVALATGCDNKNSQNDSWENRRITMEVGKGYLVNDQYLMYHGMNTEKTFAMSHTGRGAANVFYPTSAKEFGLYDHNFRLEEITPDRIILTYIGKDE